MASLIPTDSSLVQAMRWLTLHAGFPAQRLPVKAELLVLLAAVAGEAEQVQEAKSRASGSPHGPTTTAHLRNYRIQRRRANVVCNNRAKV